MKMIERVLEIVRTVDLQHQAAGTVVTSKETEVTIATRTFEAFEAITEALVHSNIVHTTSAGIFSGKLFIKVPA